jgi:hypothetical protein
MSWKEGCTPLADLAASRWSEHCSMPAEMCTLVERGARHHIFSAIAVQDLELIERVVEENPDALAHRLSTSGARHSPSRCFAETTKPCVD